MVGERPKPFGEALGFDPIMLTLIFGEYDAVLVDAMGTVAEAEALADWVALHNRNLRSDDGAIPALGGQSVVVDVWIPGGITHINRGSRSLRTLEEAADNELAHIQEHRIRFQKGEQQWQLKEKS